MLYKIVLPDFHSPALSYTVERIERDINKLRMSDETRAEAQNKWEKLKADFSLTEDTFEVLRTLRESRNGQECLKEFLEEPVLLDCAKALEAENLLKGWLTMEHITELIEMWKKLGEKDKV